MARRPRDLPDRGRRVSRVEASSLLGIVLERAGVSFFDFATL